MVIAFIAGSVIGGLFGAALVLAYELKVLRCFKARLENIEKNYNRIRSDILQKFADEVLEMLNMYCDDGNEIYIKKRVLEVNMKSILEEFNGIKEGA